MPTGLIIFLIYLAIMIFSRMQQQAKRDARNAQKKANPVKETDITFIPGFEKSGGVKFAKEEKKESVKNAKIMVDNEVERTFRKKDIEKARGILENKKIENKLLPEEEPSLPDFHEDVLVNGIILSELLGLPKALKSGRHNGWIRMNY